MVIRKDDWHFLHTDDEIELAKEMAAARLVKSLKDTGYELTWILGIAYDLWTHGFLSKAGTMVEIIKSENDAKNLTAAFHELMPYLDEEPEDRDEFVALLQRNNITG
jgi:hypothetical protein